MFVLRNLVTKTTELLIFYWEIMKRKQLCHRNLCVYFPRYSLVFFVPVTVNNTLSPPSPPSFTSAKYISIFWDIFYFLYLSETKFPWVVQVCLIWIRCISYPTFSFYLCHGYDSIVLIYLFICLYFIYYLNSLRAGIIPSSFLNPYI